MIDIKLDEKEQKVLEKFFVEQVKVWNPEVWGIHFVAVLMIVIAMLADCFPFMMWEGDYEGALIMEYLLIMGLEIYVHKYCYCRESGKQGAVYDRLQYLPVSHKQIHLFRMKKLATLCAKLTVVGVVFQNLFGVAYSHHWSILLILMPVLWTFVCPMVFLGILEVFRK